MAFETGTANSQEDLVSKIFTFLTSNGWTQDEFTSQGASAGDTGQASIHRGDVYVHFRWFGSDLDNIAMYQSTGYTALNDPWDHPNDSGNGTTSASSLSTQRRVEGIGNGPFTKYWFFEDDTTAPYFYCVLEYSPGLFRHFGFGNIEKIGTWTGGEFCAGHSWPSPSSPTGSSNTLLMDGLHTSTSASNELEPATIRIGSGFPNQGASIWANVGNGTSTWVSTDRAGNTRSKVVGGMRASFMLKAHGGVASSPLNGYTSLIPIPIFYEDFDPTDNVWVPLGYMIDCRHINIKNYSAGEEVSVGSDTWVLFPIVRKRFLNDGQEESRNGGIAYRKVV